jgi:hypothetical protein
VVQPPRRAWRSAGVPERLHGRPLAVARTCWLIGAIGLIVLVSVGFTRAFEDPQRVELGPLSEVFATLGLNQRVMIAVALVAPFLAVVAICGIVFWRHARDPMALLFTFTLLALFSFSSRALVTYGGELVLPHPASVALAVTLVGMSLVFGLFPDGRFRPSFAVVLVPATVAFVVVFPDAVETLEGLLDGEVEVGRSLALASAWTVILGVGIGVQVHRYRHVSSPRQRQQAKWVMVPLSLWVLVVTVVVAIPVLAPARSELVVGWWLLVAVIPLGIVGPVMIANAVLRYRLYEIDRIISRTASYGLLVAILGAVYSASVLAVGGAVSAVTGQETSDLVIAASVLAVVALFRPLRRRIQAVVDRRFNRTGYEAQLEVEAFVHGLRDEVGLETVQRQLAATATRAVEPALTMVWLADRDAAAPTTQGTAHPGGPEPSPDPERSPGRGLSAGGAHR